MDKMYTTDFNTSMSEDNVQYIKLDELNDMLSLGILKLDRTKLKEYHFDTRVNYDSKKYTRKEAMKMFENLV